MWENRKIFASDRRMSKTVLYVKTKTGCVAVQYIRTEHAGCLIVDRTNKLYHVERSKLLDYRTAERLGLHPERA